MSVLRMTEEAYAMRLKRAAARKKAAPTVAPTPKPQKYRNRRTADGYASQKEAKRAAELKLLEAAGEIRGLREQVAFELVPKQGISRPVRYVADFCYEELVYAGIGVYRHRWQPIVEDVKSPATRKLAAYVIKRKLMLHVHGIAIRET